MTKRRKLTTGTLLAFITCFSPGFLFLVGFNAIQDPLTMIFLNIFDFSDFFYLMLITVGVLFGAAALNFLMVRDFFSNICSSDSQPLISGEWALFASSFPSYALLAGKFPISETTTNLIIGFSQTLAGAIALSAFAGMMFLALLIFASRMIPPIGNLLDKIGLKVLDDTPQLILISVFIGVILRYSLDAILTLAGFTIPNFVGVFKLL